MAAGGVSVGGSGLGVSVGSGVFVVVGGGVSEGVRVIKAGRVAVALAAGVVVCVTVAVAVSVGVGVAVAVVVGTGVGVLVGESGGGVRVWNCSGVAAKVGVIWLRVGATVIVGSSVGEGGSGWGCGVADGVDVRVIMAGRVGRALGSGARR